MSSVPRPHVKLFQIRGLAARLEWFNIKWSSQVVQRYNTIQ